MEHGAMFVATCLAAALDRRHGALRQLSDRARAWHGALTMVLTLLLVMLLDTAGTLIGVARQAGLLDKGSRRPRLRQALLADSGGAMLGAALGTSTNTAYIKSAAGVEEGGRTGLTATRGGGAISGEPVSGAARPDRSALRHGACASLRRLPDGHEPRRDPVGRANRGHPGTHHRADVPLELFDRHRHWARLHRLRRS